MRKHIKFVHETYRKDLTHIKSFLWFILSWGYWSHVSNHSFTVISTFPYEGDLLTDILNSVTRQRRTIIFAAQLLLTEREFTYAHTNTPKPEQLELPTSLINSAIHHPKCYIWELGEEGAYIQSDLIITSAKSSQPSISFQQEVTFKKNTQKKATFCSTKPTWNI